MDKMLTISKRLISVLLISGLALSQRTIEGVIFDSSTGEPIEGVNISVEGIEAGTSTDESGRFSLMIEGSEATLLVKHIAYESTDFAIKKADNNVRIELTPEVISLTELDVFGDTDRGEFSQLETKNMVTDIKVDNISIRGYSDIGDVLQNEETVLVTESSTGTKKISIRGGRQEEMVYMYDGVKMYNGGRQSLDLSMFDVGGLGAVELLRGSHENASGSSGTVNFVPELSYETSASFYQRFGTYNTGSYHTGFSLGNSSISLDIGRGEGKSRQFYENADEADILRDNSSQYISAGYRPLSTTELKFYQVKTGRVYNNYYTGDSIGSDLLLNTLKIEHDTRLFGEIDLYASSQRTTGEDAIEGLKTDRDDNQVVTGLNYHLAMENGYIKVFLDRAVTGADWTTSMGDISVERETISFSGAFGLSQNKTGEGFELKDIIVNINSNIIEENKGIESNILKPVSSIKESGATAGVSAWDHLDNTIIYLFSNIGNNFRVPSIAERYAHALRPDVFDEDTLVTEYKVMREVGIKLSSRDSESGPSYSGSMSYFSYGYTNKIKNIQYSGTPLQFPVNYGDADISGIDLNLQLFNANKWLGYKAAYSSYTFSDQLSFPMQPAAIFRQSVVIDLGNFSARVGLKNEGSRIVTTVDSDGALANNYLKGHRSLDVNVSYQLSFRDYGLSIGIFGQNLNDDSQALEGISIFDKRVYLSMGLEWK